jgi:tRNA (cmo5U34)-methyltransferase
MFGQERKMGATKAIREVRILNHNMGVATHLGIDLADYDARIRTFIPHYEEMLDVAASVIDPRSRTIVDLGVGTGALSERCLRTAPGAKIVGVDADAEVLKAAAQRLSRSATFICALFVRAQVPRCDAVVASFALHHVRTTRAKAKLYASLASAIQSGGQLVNVDCQPASDRKIAQKQFAAWKAHLRTSYSVAEAAKYLAAWSQEDEYVPLDAEIGLMRKAGLTVEVLWRKDAFAVLRGKLD